jgi:hypothetical protein
MYSRKLCGNYIMKWNKNLHPIDRRWLEVRNPKINTFEALLGGYWVLESLDTRFNDA